MAVIWPVARRLLPESTGDCDGPWDVLGAVMAAAGILGAVFAVKHLGTGTLPQQPSVFVPLLGGVALLWLFVRRQRRIRHPLLDMRWFSRPAFSTSVGCIVVAMLALVGLELIAVQYLQLVLGLEPVETGLRLLPLTVAAMAAGLAGSRMLHRLGPRLMTGLGFVLTAGAVLTLTAMSEHDRPWLLTGAFVVLGFGLQTSLFGAYESMLDDVPADRAGGAAAICETSYQLGAGMGIALLGSVMNAAYAPGVSGVPGVPTAAREAAGRSLSEAYAAADALGEPVGDALRGAARHSFVHGLHVTLVVSAVLLMLGAVAALRLPRAAGLPDLSAREANLRASLPSAAQRSRVRREATPQAEAGREQDQENP
jgi:DHA2 family multidrug resistance protein-like MFS transporter